MGTPKQKWLTVFNFGAKMFEVLDIRVYTDMKNGWLSYSGAALSFLYVALVSYTMWFYYEEGDFLKGMECTYTAGIVITVRILFNEFRQTFIIIFLPLETIFQIITLYWTVIGPKRFNMNSALNFGGKYIYRDDKRPSKYNTVCQKMVDQLVLTVSILAFMNIFSHALLGILPFYLIIFKGVRVTVMGLELPFLEPGSDIGFAVNLLVQSVLGIVSIVALIAFQVLYMCSTAVK